MTIAQPKCRAALARGLLAPAAAAECKPHWAGRSARHAVTHCDRHAGSRAGIWIALRRDRLLMDDLRAFADLLIAKPEIQQWGDHDVPEITLQCDRCSDESQSSPVTPITLPRAQSPLFSRWRAKTLELEVWNDLNWDQRLHAAQDLPGEVACSSDGLTGNLLAIFLGKPARRAALFSRVRVERRNGDCRGG